MSRTAVSFFALLAAPGLARADVLINEFVPDPAGVDSGYEWIEIVNTGAAAVDISNWLFERSTSGVFLSKYTFPAGTVIDPGERLVVGEEFVTGADFSLAAGVYLSLGNATASGDALRLCDDLLATIDTVVYGPNNTDGFLDDTGGLALPAPDPMEDDAIARSPDGADTDDSSADFVVDDTPTLGLDNATPPPAGITVSTGAPGLAGVANTWDLTGAPASANVIWIWGAVAGTQAMPGGSCPGTDMGIVNPKKLGNSTTDATGAGQFVAVIPAAAAGATMRVQAILPSTCEVSDVSATVFP